MKKVFYFLMLVGILGCYRQSTPEKPDTVPDEAKWVGGLDGGVWLQINEVISNNSILANVYFESGNERDKGLFVAEDCFPDDILITKKFLYESANSYDGVRLSFKHNNRYFYMVYKPNEE